MEDQIPLAFLATADDITTSEEKDSINSNQNDQWAVEAIERGIRLRLAFNFKHIRFVKNRVISANANNSPRSVFSFTVSEQEPKTFEFLQGSELMREFNIGLQPYRYLVIAHRGERWLFYGHPQGPSVVNVVTFADGDEDIFDIPIQKPLTLLMKAGFTYNCIFLSNDENFQNDTIQQVCRVDEDEDRVLARNLDEAQEIIPIHGLRYRIHLEPFAGERAILQQTLFGYSFF